ncbi:MAG: hypothetical protein OXD33_09830 [Rhodobacteraceae bacterium]|nr:hypothetical protein [Paracoccaceae bacterium]
MIIQRRKGLTEQLTGQTRNHIAQIARHPARILPKQTNQIIHEARVLQLRSGRLQGARDPLSRLCRYDPNLVPLRVTEVLAESIFLDSNGSQEMQC